MAASPPEPQPQPQSQPPASPVQNNVSGTQNNVGGDQYNAARDQFVGNQNVKAVNVSQGAAAAGRLGCLTINVAVTVVSAMAVLAVSSFVVLNFVLASPDLNAISVGGDQAMRGPGLAAPTTQGTARGWAVGKGGAILYYDSSSWRSYASPTTINLTALYYDGTNGWIVGDGGNIFHIGQNDAITPFRSPTTNNLRSVVGVNPAVATDDQGNIYYFNGALWQAAASSSLPSNLPAVVVPSQAGPLVVQADGTIRPANVQPSPNVRPPLAAGNNTVISTPINAAAAPPDGAGPNQLWAVGAKGSIYGFNNGVWDKEPSPTSANLNSIYFGTQNHGWIVGDGGVILVWNGQRWQQSNSPTGDNLNSIFVGKGNDVWAAGNHGRILHLEGGVWKQVK